jgi:hypothetical protein
MTETEVLAGLVFSPSLADPEKGSAELPLRTICNTGPAYVAQRTGVSNIELSPFIALKFLDTTKAICNTGPAYVAQRTGVEPSNIELSPFILLKIPRHP